MGIEHLIILGMLLVLFLVALAVPRTRSSRKTVYANIGSAQIALTALRFDQMSSQELNRWAEKYEYAQDAVDKAVYELIQQELLMRAYRYSRHFDHNQK